MLRSVGESTQPCFTPLLIGNGSEVEPSYWTVPSWKTLSSLGACGWVHQIFCKRLNRPFLMTGSKTLVKSTKR